MNKFEKINDTQAKIIVQSEMIIDASETKRQIGVWQSKIDSTQATIDQYNKEIEGFQAEIDKCQAQLVDLEAINVKPAIEPVEEKIVSTDLKEPMTLDSSEQSA